MLYSSSSPTRSLSLAPFLSDLTSSPGRPRRISNRKDTLVRKYRNYRSRQCIMASEQKKLIVLISQGCHDRTQSANQSKALDWLNSKNVPHSIVDGMDPNQRERRNQLFEISGVRGNYPQFFFENKDGEMIYFDFERLEGWNETNGLSAEILAQHPELETWGKVFGNVVESFS
mmetsp:Transcript_2146/g.4624  ORF Transcript_2146/g.4624 Transcript_2146/m.4624 type:complete len:173 (-) Transcript_2146:229-747(-)